MTSPVVSQVEFRSLWLQTLNSSLLDVDSTIIHRVLSGKKIIRMTGRERNILKLISVKAATARHKLNYTKAVMTTVILFQALI